MDLFDTYTFEDAVDNRGTNTITYFLHTVHGRKISVAVFNQTSDATYECLPTTDWERFLCSSGFDRVLPMRFRTKTELEHKVNHFLRAHHALHPLPACPKSNSFHYPDVLGSSLVWYMIDDQDVENAQIPPCMHRHLFEHTKAEAVLRYGNGLWPVPVRAYTFGEEFANFLVDNGIRLDVSILLRHIGNFMFDVLVFDTAGHSRNLGEPPNDAFDPALPDTHFFVYVKSALAGCSYTQLFRSSSFLYIPTKTETETCVEFLSSCCDLKGRVLIMHGEAQDPFFANETDLLQEIQFNFHIDPDCTLAFFKHGRGRVKLLAISPCGVEDPPRENQLYEIGSQACTHIPDHA